MLSIRNEMNTYIRWHINFRRWPELSVFAECVRTCCGSRKRRRAPYKYPAGVCVPSIIRATCKEYCRYSVIHGVRYFVDERTTRLERYRVLLTIADFENLRYHKLKGGALHMWFYFDFTVVDTRWLLTCFFALPAGCFGRSHYCCPLLLVWAW